MPVDKGPQGAPSRITPEDVLSLRASFEGVREAIEDMSTRQTTAEAKVEEKADTSQVDALRSMLIGLVVLLLLVIAFGFIGWRNNNDRIEDIINARTQSRAGLCGVLDDMRAKHNLLVQTAIDERQALIDASMDNPNTSQAQKEATVQFFSAQIANYQTGILTIVDCTNKKAVDDFLTSLTIPPS